MTYLKTTWINDETKLNQINMNHIENGIENNEGTITNLNNDVDTNKTNIIQLLGIDENDNISIINNNKLNSNLKDKSFIKENQTSSNIDTYSCLYTNNNLVIPQSSIEESGTNYIRFSDGTQIVYDSPIASSSTGIDVEFPKAFKTGTTPMLKVSVPSSRNLFVNSYGNVTNIGFHVNTYRVLMSSITISGVNFEYMYYRDYNYGAIDYIAIGKWK